MTYSEASKEYQKLGSDLIDVEIASGIDDRLLYDDIEPVPLEIKEKIRQRARGYITNDLGGLLDPWKVASAILTLWDDNRSVDPLKIKRDDISMALDRDEF